MLIRTATMADAAVIADLWSRNGLGAGRVVDLQEIQTRLSTDDDYFLVGFDPDDGDRNPLRATVMGCYDGHRGHVKRVAVDPDHHGKGLAQRIMAELERRYRRDGITKLRLQVWSDNGRAGQFWEAASWTELEQIRYFTKDLDD